MSIRVAALVVTYFLLLTLMARGAAGESHFDFGPPMRLRDAEQGSLLLRTELEGVFLPAPVLETEVRIRVAGLLARATVTQRFHNPTQEWLEGVYVFPLPDTAAVDGLRMIVGERIVEGRIKEREEAKRVYTEARAQGKKASLVEQERPNIFTTSVANIGPQEDIEIVIEYQEDLRYQGGRFELRFPMVVGPRFIPGAEGIEGFDGTGWGRNTPQVPDAERITPPVIHPDRGPSIRFGSASIWTPESRSRASAAPPIRSGSRSVEHRAGSSSSKQEPSPPTAISFSSGSPRPRSSRVQRSSPRSGVEITTRC